VFDRHTHYHYGGAHDGEVPRWAAALQRQNNIIISKLEAIVATLDQVLTDVTDESTRLDSISTLIAGLKQQVADALSGATLSPAVQAKIDQVFQAAETNKGKIDTALNTNVPASSATS